MTVKVNKRRLKKMLAYNPAAIIQFNIDTIESCTQLLANVDVPILEIGALNTHPVGMCIGVDYGKAVKQIVTHLADASLKNIALLCTPANNTMFRQLLSGWNTAMLALNRSPAPGGNHAFAIHHRHRRQYIQGYDDYLGRSGCVNLHVG